MDIPGSEHFTPVDLSSLFNAVHSDLPESLALVGALQDVFDAVSFRGIPFLLGPRGGSNVILLQTDIVTVDLGGSTATYLVFPHVADVTEYVPYGDLGGGKLASNPVGAHVSDYIVEYDDGMETTLPIRQRFAVQQGLVSWGASAFDAVPATEDQAWHSNAESLELGQFPIGYGRGETGGNSGRDLGGQQVAWLCALPNPTPAKRFRQIRLESKETRSAIYGLALTQLSNHPLRYRPREKLLLTKPEGATVNAIDELESVDIDLGIGPSPKPVRSW